MTDKHFWIFNSIETQDISVKKGMKVFFFLLM